MSISLFNILKMPLNMLPQLISLMAQVTPGRVGDSAGVTAGCLGHLGSGGNPGELLESGSGGGLFDIMKNCLKLNEVIRVQGHLETEEVRQRLWKPEFSQLPLTKLDPVCGGASQRRLSHGRGPSVGIWALRGPAWPRKFGASKGGKEWGLTHTLLQTSVSLKRIQHFLSQDELDFECVERKTIAPGLDSLYLGCPLPSSCSRKSSVPSFTLFPRGPLLLLLITLLQHYAPLSASSRLSALLSFIPPQVLPSLLPSLGLPLPFPLPPSFSAFSPWPPPPEIPIPLSSPSLRLPALSSSSPQPSLPASPSPEPPDPVYLGLPRPCHHHTQQHLHLGPGPAPRPAQVPASPIPSQRPKWTKGQINGRTPASPPSLWPEKQESLSLPGWYLEERRIWVSEWNIGDQKPDCCL